MSNHFDGGFDLLPILAHLECGPVPMHPTGEDFQRAAMCAAVGDEDGIISKVEAAGVWQREAIRWRMGHGGCALDIPAISRNVAAELYKRATA